MEPEYLRRYFENVKALRGVERVVADMLNFVLDPNESVSAEYVRQNSVENLPNINNENDPSNCSGRLSTTSTASSDSGCGEGCDTRCGMNEEALHQLRGLADEAIARWLRQNGVSTNTSR